MSCNTDLTSASEVLKYTLYGLAPSGGGVASVVRLRIPLITIVHAGGLIVKWKDMTQALRMFLDHSGIWINSKCVVYCPGWDMIGETEFEGAIICESLSNMYISSGFLAREKFLSSIADRYASNRAITVSHASSVVQRMKGSSFADKYNHMLFQRSEAIIHGGCGKWKYEYDPSCLGQDICVYYRMNQVYYPTAKVYIRDPNRFCNIITTWEFDDDNNADPQQLWVEFTDRMEYANGDVPTERELGARIREVIQYDDIIKQYPKFDIDYERRKSFDVLLRCFAKNKSERLREILVKAVWYGSDSLPYYIGVSNFLLHKAAAKFHGSTPKFHVRRPDLLYRTRCINHLLYDWHKDICYDPIHEIATHKDHKIKPEHVLHLRKQTTMQSVITDLEKRGIRKRVMANAAKLKSTANLDRLYDAFKNKRPI